MHKADNRIVYQLVVAWSHKMLQITIFRWKAHLDLHLLRQVKLQHRSQFQLKVLLRKLKEAIGAQTHL
jgi:hypothetical protein